MNHFYHKYYFLNLNKDTKIKTRLKELFFNLKEFIKHSFLSILVKLVSEMIFINVYIRIYVNYHAEISTLPP